jgi:NADH-quinone oxidoreductase subunit L
MGGLKDRLPLVFYTFLTASLAISGFPFFSGFWSKDEIIALAFTSPSGNVVLGLIALVTAGLTAVYIFRAVFMTFFGKSQVPPELADHLHPPGAVMAVPLVILAVLSFVGGYVQVPTEGFASFLEPAFRNSNYSAPLVTGGFNLPISILSALFAIGGIAIAYAIWYRSPATAESLARRYAGVREVLLNDYGIDAAYNRVFVGATRGLGRLAAYVVDPRVIDGIVNFFPRAVGWSSGGIASWESGYVRSYATWILIGALLVVLAFVFRGGL